MNELVKQPQVQHCPMYNDSTWAIIEADEIKEDANNLKFYKLNPRRLEAMLSTAKITSMVPIITQ